MLPYGEIEYKDGSSIKTHGICPYSIKERKLSSRVSPYKTEPVKVTYFMKLSQKEEMLKLLSSGFFKEYMHPESSGIPTLYFDGEKYE